MAKINLYCSFTKTSTIMKKLNEIATIQAGHSFREKIEPDAGGNYRVIQIKDVGTDGSLLTDEILKTRIEKVRPEFFVQKGDVLFTTRGVNRRACSVEKELPNTVFVAQIFALRNLDALVKPSYLAWYINQKPAQEYLESMASGSYIQNVRKDILADMPVVLPPKDVQKKIVAVARLAWREKYLLEQIKEKRNQFVERVLLDAIKNDSGEEKL